MILQGENDGRLHPGEDLIMPPVDDAESSGDVNDAPDDALAELLEVLHEAHGGQFLSIFETACRGGGSCF